MHRSIPFPRTIWLRRLASRLLLALLLPASLPLSAQERVSEDSLKAAFVFNFAKFTDWPNVSDDNQPIRLCALGSNPLDGQLAQLDGRQIGHHLLAVRLNVRSQEWPRCHLLYLSEADTPHLDNILRTVGSQPVVVIGNGSQFASSGGMIGIHPANSRLRFDVNLQAANRAGLKFSSQMLRLAALVVR